MRYFRHLPPLLRATSIFEWLFFLASIALWTFALVTSPPPFSHLSSGASRLEVIAGNLAILGLDCAFAVQTYSMRFRQPDKGPFPLTSWQSQLRAIALAAALPLCALVLAVVIPVTARTFEIVFPLTLVGAVVLLAGYLSMYIGRQATD